MKANELQVGDYLSYNGQVIKVESITKKKVGYHLKPNECRLHYARLCECKPIPITTEILEKNGFKLNPQGSYSIGRNVSIDILDGHYNANINTDNPQVPSFLYLVGSYVHELQHALRLCRIEKTIEL